MNVRVIEPGDPCDRCSHASRQHAPPEKRSACQVKDCHCDGFFPVPAQREVSA